VLTDGKQSIEVYATQGDLHSDELLVAYLPGPKILVEADAYSPGPPDAPPPSPLVALWFLGAGSARLVVLCASLSYVFVASNSVACYLYTPEIYPTRLRALGSSIATAWLRIGYMVGPGLVAVMLTRSDLKAVFLMFGFVALAGTVVAGTFAIETRERVLEEVSP
jgi:putative MFS transporter